MTKKIPCEVYTRVVGYYRPVQNWNAGKEVEYHDRLPFSEKDSVTVPTRNAELPK